MRGPEGLVSPPTYIDSQYSLVDSTRASMESPGPQPLTGRYTMNTSYVDMDLDSIQARRAQLKALTTSVRLPPLVPSDDDSTRHDHEHAVFRRDTGRSTSSGERYMKQRQRSEQQQRSSKTSVTSARARSATVKLPKLSIYPMASHSTPLPNIGETRRQTDNVNQYETKMASPPSPVYEDAHTVNQWAEDARQNNMNTSSESSEDRKATPPSGKRKTPVTTTPGAEPQPPGSRSPDTELVSPNKRPETASDAPESRADSKTHEKEDFDQIVSDMASEDLATRLVATTKARRLLSMETAPPIEQFLQADILTPAMANLQEENFTLLFETAWIITNISSGTSSDAEVVVERGFIPPLVHLVTTAAIEIREQVTWALGNIAGDRAEYRDLVVAAGALPPLLDLLNLDIPVSFVRNISWMISNLFRFKPLMMSEEEKTRVLQAEKDHLLVHRDTEVYVDSLWTISYYADLGNQYIHQVVEAGIIPLLVQHLSSQERKVVHPAVRALGIITSGTDFETDAVLEAGVLPVYSRLLSTNMRVKKEIAWSVSNILAGTCKQIHAVIKSGILHELMQAVQTDEVSVKKEVIWALSNMTQRGTQVHMDALLQVGGLQLLVDSLLADNVKIVMVAAQGIKNILEKYDNVEAIKEMLEECGGVDYMETNLQHVDDRVVSKMNEILNTFFPDPTFPFPAELEENLSASIGLGLNLSRKASKYVAAVSP